MHVPARPVRHQVEGLSKLDRVGAAVHREVARHLGAAKGEVARRRELGARGGGTAHARGPAACRLRDRPIRRSPGRAGARRDGPARLRGGRPHHDDNPAARARLRVAGRHLVDDRLEVERLRRAACGVGRRGWGRGVGAGARRTVSLVIMACIPACCSSSKVSSEPSWYSVCRRQRKQGLAAARVVRAPARAEAAAGGGAGRGGGGGGGGVEAGSTSARRDGRDARQAHLQVDPRCVKGLVVVLRELLADLCSRIGRDAWSGSAASGQPICADGQTERLAREQAHQQNSRWLPSSLRHLLRSDGGRRDLQARVGPALRRGHAACGLVGRGRGRASEREEAGGAGGAAAPADGKRCRRRGAKTMPRQIEARVCVRARASSRAIWPRRAAGRRRAQYLSRTTTTTSRSTSGSSTARQMAKTSQPPSRCRCHSQRIPKCVRKKARST